MAISNISIKLAKNHDIELKFQHSYFGENDRGMFTWKTESLDAMDEKFQKLFHDSGYQTLNQKITELTLDRSSHDDIWRQISDLSF